MARISLSPPRTPLFRIVDWYCRRLPGPPAPGGRGAQPEGPEDPSG